MALFLFVICSVASVSTLSAAMLSLLLLFLLLVLAVLLVCPRERIIMLDFVSMGRRAIICGVIIRCFRGGLLLCVVDVCNDLDDGLP